MRFVVIGCGSIGNRHIGNLISLGHEVVAYNRGQARREVVAARHRVPVFADLNEMFDAFPAHAAVVATPQMLHLEFALAAARRGLHLFIEKPLSHSLEGFDELASEVEAAGLVSHVGANMRFHFGPKSVHSLILDGTVGRPLWAFLWGGMHLPDWHPDEDYREMYSAKKSMGGGVVMDFIHELDLALWLFGKPDRLAAMVSHSGWLEIETEDVADILMGYLQGLQVSVHLDYLQKPFQRGIRVVGERGWVQWDLAAQTVSWFVYKTGVVHQAKYPDGYDHNTMYIEQMQYFVNCIKNEKQSESDIGAGRAALEVALESKRLSKLNDFINWRK